MKKGTEKIETLADLEKKAKIYILELMVRYPEGGDKVSSFYMNLADAYKTMCGCHNGEVK